MKDFVKGAGRISGRGRRLVVLPKDDLLAMLKDVMSSEDVPDSARAVRWEMDAQKRLGLVVASPEWRTPPDDLVVRISRKRGGLS